jgi:hypothetical protein
MSSAEADVAAFFVAGDAQVSEVAQAYLSRPTIPVDSAHVLRFASGCGGSTISKSQLLTFLRIFGPKESAVLTAWKVVFDQTTGALQPWFWADAERQALRDRVARCAKDEGPFAARFSKQRAIEGRFGLVVIYFGSAGTISESLLLADDARSRFYFVGREPEDSPSAVLRRWAASGFRTPITSEISERSADAAVALPHWTLQSPELRGVLSYLAQGVPRLGAHLLHGLDSGAPETLATRRAMCATALDAARAHPQPAFVVRAQLFAGAACVAAALGEKYSRAIGIVNAAISLVQDFRRRRAEGEVGVSPLYPVPDRLLLDAVKLAGAALSLGLDVEDEAERFFVRCKACNALYLAVSEQRDVASARSVAELHLALLKEARPGTVPPDQLAIVQGRCARG